MKLYFDIEAGPERIQVFRWLKKGERNYENVCLEYLGGITPLVPGATTSGAWISDNVLTSHLIEFGLDVNFDEIWTYGPNGSREWHSCFAAMRWLTQELEDQ